MSGWFDTDILNPAISIVAFIGTGLFFIWKEIRDHRTEMKDDIKTHAEKLDKSMEIQSQRMDKSIEIHSQRSDKLYEMFYELLKEGRK